MATTVNFAADNTLTVADKNLSSNVTVTTDGHGTISMGSGTISGTVGTTGNRLKQLTVTTADTLVLSSASFADDMTVTGTGTLDFNANSTVTNNIDFTGDGFITVANGVSLAAAVDGSGANDGTLTFENTTSTGGIIGGTNGIATVSVTTGTLSLGHAITSTDTNVTTTATLALTGNRTVTGDLTLAGTGVLDLNGNTLTLAGTGILDTGAGASAINLDIASATSFGNVAAAATGIAVVPVTTGVTVNVTCYVADATAFTIVDGNGGGTVAGGNTVTDNSAVLNFAAAASSGDLILTASRSGTAYNDLASGGNAAAAGAALESAGADDPTGDMLTFLNTIDLLTAAEIETAMDTMGPDMSAGTLAGSLNALNQSLGTVTHHLSNVRSGVATGSGIEEGSIWAKGFGNFADQGTRNGIRGYESYTYGAALGFDMLADTNVTLGISGGYAYTKVDPKAANLNNADINSSQGTLYGSYDGGPWYFDGAFAFAWNTYESSRRIVFGTTSRISKADYDGQQYSVYGGAGYTIENDGLEITPVISLQYTRLHLDDYTETGAGSLSLRVSDQDYDVLESGIGAKIAYPLTNDEIIFIPEIHGMWYYDYMDEKAQQTSRFNGGGASFATNGADPAQSSWDVGSQLTFITTTDISLILGYDLELKDDFYGHSGAVTVKYDF